MKTLARKLRRTALLPALALGLASLGLATPVLAQDTPPGQEITPEARAVIDRMTDYIKNLPAYSIQAHGTRDEVIEHGYKLQHNESASLQVQRPDHMRAKVSGDLRNREFVYDGKTIVVSSPDDNAYAVTPTTETLGTLIGDMLDSGVELPLIDVLYQATAGTLTENVRTGTLVGETSVEGVACDHLAFRQTDADWQLWVEKGARALPRKIVITTRHEVGDPQFSAVLTWNTQPKFAKDSFSFVPPKDAHAIPFVAPDALAGGEK
jgi:hypothetical protein